jgi:hypothetical protein
MSLFAAIDPKPTPTMQSLDCLAETALVIKTLVEVSRVSTTTEKKAQADLAALFTRLEYRCEREHKLSAEDTPDFYLPDIGLVIEVKIRGAQKMAVYRQLERYAEHDIVQAVMLITSLAMGLPPAINGKPTYYASLGKGWL